MAVAHLTVAMDLQRIPVRFRVPTDGLPLVQAQFGDSSIDVLATGEEGAEAEIWLTHEERAVLTHTVHSLDGVILSVGIE
jgi:hypothetical protein